MAFNNENNLLCRQPVTKFMRSMMAATLSGALLGTGGAMASENLDDLLDLNLEDLLTLEVSSVSRKLEKLRNAAAAVYVLTGDEIRRTGAISIPDALRTVPGLQVGQINANQSIVSVRGFGGRWSNKLLVLIDGRTIYMPSYAGVYWDEHDIPIENIDRIEVIRGPGATLWGANAVNGIINIITRDATGLNGGQVALASGSEVPHDVFARQHFSISKDVDSYVYAKLTARDSSNLSGGGDANDDWKTHRAGFRIDGRKANEWGLQGDVYENDGNQLVVTELSPKSTITGNGWFLSGYMKRELNEDQNVHLKVYYDHQERSEVFVQQQHDTIDIDFQHNVMFGSMHDLVWGLGLRQVNDDFSSTSSVTFTPSSRETSLYSLFVQDEVTLLPDQLSLIVGSKYEHNDFTGDEIQPNLRMVWQPDEAQTVWGSVSKAVHVPARVDEDGVIHMAFPGRPALDILGNKFLESEELIAYELGYRWFPEGTVTLDAAFFYNDYSKLFGGMPDPLNPLRINFVNLYEGQSWGGELSLKWKPSETWRVTANYSHISLDTSSDFINRNTPENQLSLTALWDICPHWMLDTRIRYVGKVAWAREFGPVSPIDDYTALDLHLSWHPVAQLSVSLNGRNVTDAQHQEAIGEVFTPATNVPRSLAVEIEYRW